MKDGVYQDDAGKWAYRLRHSSGTGYATKQLAARAYVNALVQQQPKYKELLKGRTWAEIYRMVGISL